MGEEEKNIKKVGFTVDAGLIQRLGYELVGRAETAVSELIKNAYDADATIVDVDFIDSNIKGGTLIVSDNGVGMTENQLINGFMRISSADKVHNPISKRFGRRKAGRKGIGRFATQRLGEELIIITQTKDAKKASRIVIKWNEYTIDRELSSITFPIEEIDKVKEEGTILIIGCLRDGWTIASIKRVYRYVLDLFQPNYLSDRSKKHNSAIQNEESFKVNFAQEINGDRDILINDQISIFNKALAVFEGYIDNQHKGSVHIKSEGLKIDDIIDIEYNKKNEDGKGIEKYYSNLEDVHFKIHYFIYSRPQYYGGKVTNLELSGIQELSKTASGVRLYRNGFRVLPYGEPTDDWTNIDRRWASESGVVNVPLNNKNLYGFVEITDPGGALFEETASREGLIENEAFRQLSDFLHKSLVAARQRVSEGVTLFKEQFTGIENSVEDSEEKQQSTEEKLKALENLVENLDNKENDSEDNNSSHQSPEGEEEKKAQRKKLVASIRKEIEEASMLRVLAGMGLIIGEFSHEVKQFQPSIYGYISQLREEKLTENGIIQLDGITYNLNNLIAYTAYFNATVSQNINRETEPIDVLAVLDAFQQTIANDLLKSRIGFEVDVWDYDVVTIPMHKSEWSSLLFNLYTNAKKAINRAQQIDGKIFIEVGIANDNVFLNFYDNGDGIPIENQSRVFNAFFTTSTPAGFDAPRNEQLVGSGLGLKIVKDIVISYKGKIFVSTPIDGFETCIRIEIPRLKQ
jgi:histidine kinase